MRLNWEPLLTSAPQLRLCPLCAGGPRRLSPIHSSFSDRTFQLGVCDSCQLGLVLDPRTDFERLYGIDYYQGRGADPLVNYFADEQPGSTRELEWSGLLRTIRDIARVQGARSEDLKLLDWGAGLGGLVRCARESGIRADGFDEGYASATLGEKGLLAPPLSERQEYYDVVTAIEVVEHLIEPAYTLEAIGRCLKPGGFLFVTTGNFAKVRGPLNRWYYAQIPDVHVTFWSPASWSKALRLAGLDPSPLPLSRVDPRILQYKLLKSLPRFNRPLKASLALWAPVTRFVDRRYGVSDFAIGIKR